MKMRVFIFWSLIFFSLLSCTEQDRELIIIGQEADIDRYISTEHADGKIVRLNGSNRIILNEISPEIDSLEFGDSLSFYYSGFIFNNGPSAMFATNNKEVAEAEGAPFILSNADYSPIKILFEEGILTSGLTNGLLGVQEKEHCIIIFSAKYGFNDDSVYNIPKLSALIYEVWIDKVKKNN